MTPADVEYGALPPLFDAGSAVRILWRRRLLVAGATIGAILTAGLYLAVTKPVYTATATLLVDPRDPQAVSFNNVLPGIGADSAAIASQVNVIESQDLLGSVFDAQKIASDPEFDGPGRMARLLALLGHPGTVNRDTIFRRFQQNVSVAREGLTYVIDVSFTSHDPQKAARVANAIVEAYKSGQAGEKEAANTEVSAVLKDKIATLQKSVSEAERAVEDFKFQHRIYDSGAGGTLQSQIDQLSAQLLTAQDQADQAQDKYDQARAAGTAPGALGKLSEILSSPATEKLRDDYNQRAAALANLETVYGPRHPAVVRLQTELEKVRGLMATEAQRITRQLKAARDLAAQNVATLQQKIAQLRDRANQADLAGVQLRQLQRNADAARAVLDDFLKRAQETSQLKGLQISQVRVISPAVAPVQPAWPKPFLLMPVSAVLGFLAGCGLALSFGEPARTALRPRAAPARREDPLPEPPAPVGPPPPGGAIDVLGNIAIPLMPGRSWQGGLQTMRARIFAEDGAVLPLDLLRLLKAVVGRLEGAEKPFLLLFASLDQARLAAMAGTMLGLGLERAGESAAIVRIEAPRSAGTPLLSLARPEETAIAEEEAGLRSVKLPSVSPDGRPLPDRILEAVGPGCDFILVEIGALGDADWDADLVAVADLLVFAMAAEDKGSAELLAEILPASLRSMAAGVIVSTAEGTEVPKPGGSEHARAARG